MNECNIDVCVAGGFYFAFTTATIKEPSFPISCCLSVLLVYAQNSTAIFPYEAEDSENESTIGSALDLASGLCN